MKLFLKFIGIALFTTLIACGAVYLWNSESNAPTQNPYIPQGEQGMVGASVPVVVSIFETSLQSAISSSATSMTLVSGTDRVGTALAGFECFTLDEGTSVAEFTCGNASGTSVTSLTRGISPTTGTSSVTSLKFAHRRGASVKITNYPQLAILSRILNGDETIPNKLTYDSSVASSTMGSNLQNVASVAYVNSVATFGAADATTAVKGIVQAGTASQIVAGTGTGGTGALLFAPGSLYNATSSATNLIPITRATGKLSQGFLDLTEAFSFSATSTLAATSSAPLILRGISYAFPLTQGTASTTLINNGSGSLSWTPMFSFGNSTTTAINSSWTNTSGSTTIASIAYTPSTPARLMVTGILGLHNNTVQDGCNLLLYIDNVSQGNVAMIATPSGATAPTPSYPANFTYITSQLSATTHTLSIAGQVTGGGTCDTPYFSQFSVFNAGN